MLLIHLSFVRLIDPLVSLSRLVLVPVLTFLSALCHLCHLPSLYLVPKFGFLMVLSSITLTSYYILLC